MPRVEFIPSGKFVDVDETVLISEAARRAGIEISLPCGGKGTCGRCLVKVLEGRIVQYEKPPKGSPQNYVLACKTAVGASLCRVELYEYDFSLDDDNDSSSLETFSFSPDMIDQPIVSPLIIDIPLPESEDALPDLERTNVKIQNLINVSHISWDITAIRLLPHSLRAEQGSITAMVHRKERIARVCGIKKASESKFNFGIAIDLGTTTISVALIDLVSGKISGCASGYNEQISCGEDVISRINYARNGKRLEELRKKSQNSVNRLLMRAVKQAGISSDDIFSAVISGNTTMAHLFLGISPEYLRLAPYTPAFLSLEIYAARDVGLNINPNAAVYISPAVGSYVGGDITAGILCTDIHQREEVSLFIDVGTNGEIVLGNREFLFACACSAGPAFEGGGISCGMRAHDGAVNSVGIDKNTGLPTLTVIGGGKPKGICGSGIIELVSELLYKGWMDRSGRLVRDVPSNAISVDGRKARYLLADSLISATSKELWITEQDIENVLRAKAAVFSAMSMLLEYAGLSFRDIAKIYIAGGFGSFLNINHAISIGLFPELPVEKFTYLGNASLKGSILLLVSRIARELQLKTASRMTYVNLSSQSGYTEKYTAALFFPHTDESLFQQTLKQISSR